MADFTKRGPGCDGEGGERGERGKRGHRGHRGPRGEMGATGPTGPAAAETVGPFPSPRITTIIYAREDGDDVDGDGSLDNPYRTFLRAAEDLPTQVLPGHFVIVDITGTSSIASPEILPPNYALPALNSPYAVEFTYTLPNAADYYPFNTVTAVEIIAKPKLATLTSGSNNLTSADFTTSIDPDTNLVAVQTNQTYDASVLGKMVQDGIGLRGVVWHRAPGIGGDILYLTISQSQDQFVEPIFASTTVVLPPAVGFPVGFGGILQIVEQSAVFQTSKAPGSIVTGGFVIAGEASFGLRGINIQLAPGQGGLDTQVWMSALTFLEGMKLDGLVIGHSSEIFVANSVVHDGFFDVVDASADLVASLFQRVGFIAPSLGPSSIVGFGFVFDTCTAFGPRYDFAQAVGRGGSTQIGLRNGFITGSVQDQNLAQVAAQANFPAPFIPNTLNPALQMPGFGLVGRGGFWFVDHVKISGTASDAINFDGVGSLELRSVTGGSGGLVFTDIPDAPSGGWGLFATDGVQVRIGDNLFVDAGSPASLVIGVTGQIQAGEGPGVTTTWAAVEGGTQALDIAGPNATLTRVFAKP